MIERIAIEDREQWLKLRQRDVTASVAGALLGVHEHTTAYEQWALKSGRIPPDIEENDAMLRGRLLEPVAAQLLAMKRPEWRQTVPGAYYRDPDVRLGATPDLFVDCPERGRGIVQIKTTADMIFRQKWRDETTREIVLPLWIAVQTMTEMHLTGRSWGAVALMVVGMGLDLHVIDVPMHSGVMLKTIGATRDFWRLVESGEEPAPDYGRDKATIERLYAEDDGGEIDLSGDNHIRSLLVDRAEWIERRKSAEKAIEPIDAEIKHRMGNAAVAFVGDGKSITHKTQHRREYVAKASTFRVLRCPTIA